MRLILLVAFGLLVILIALGVWLWTPDQTRPALEAKYLRSPDDMVNVEGTLIHVRDTGPRDAPTVILLHGFGASLHTWEPWAEGLQDRFRVIRFDLPGSGLSPPDSTGDYTDARAMALIQGLMSRGGIDKASLVGNSVGGRIAWSFAASHPGRVEGLVLISPDGFASPGFEYGKPPEVPAIMKLMRYALPRFMLRSNIAVGYADPAALTDAAVERYHDLMLAPGARDAMLARMEQTILTDPVPLLEQITAPTLLIWGERDAMIPFSNAADYQRHIADVRLVSFAELGHLPHEEAPVDSLPPVRAFLADLQAAPITGS
ncbi:alpha/beta fold hydrolase [Brevundimonas variabilis]|uniref:Pimeloyl-ACP methyl ester carboxylesterase n=1 Tax=Brevundimonas variabilis TaxID=74312 RepID=A0A7W9CI58_9CAUL|nr:alpha/beta fold hydrolase [Brevundimonas variabilis]MBB5746077.1 pimeloyl-ACP methyl ester carboxylesterase [Brevundimonas variabilis]